MALQQPKKPAGGAFGQFMAEKRASFMQQCQGKPVSEVSKIGGAAWKALSDTEKAPYQKLFEAAKSKYAKEFEAFIAAGGVKTKGAMALRAEKRKAKENTPQKEKDPNKPKRPAGGAFGCFLEKNRPAFMTECKGQPITAVTKLASTRWKALAEADKAIFEKAYADKKAAYEEAMKSYVPPAGAEVEEDGADEGAENEEQPPAKKAKTAPSAKKDSPAAKKTKKAEATPQRAKKIGKTPPKAPAVAKVGKVGGKGKSKGLNSQPEVELDASVVAEAQKLGWGAELRNLASRADVKSLGKSDKDLLAALTTSRGLVNPARRALLGA